MLVALISVGFSAGCDGDGGSDSGSAGGASSGDAGGAGGAGGGAGATSGGTAGEAGIADGGFDAGGAPNGGVASELLAVKNPGSGVDWWVKSFFPPDASAAKRYPGVVLVPGGNGAGSQSEKEPNPNRNPAELAKNGYVVVIFDADGRGKTAGTEDFAGHVHQDGLAAVIGAASGLPYVDAARVAVSTSSFGITMGSGALARYPALAVKFLLDFEGPANRNDTGHCDASNTGHIYHDCKDDKWWSEREAAAFIKQVGVPYLRIQNQKDHAQPDNLHAILLINNATLPAHGGSGSSPWTRVNLASMNPPNATYTEAVPPAYNPPGSVANTAALWAEMFALTP